MVMKEEFRAIGKYGIIFFQKFFNQQRAGSQILVGII